MVVSSYLILTERSHPQETQGEKEVQGTQGEKEAEEAQGGAAEPAAQPSESFAALADDGSEAWPSAHLSIKAGRQRCVVLTTGSMSPTHRGHVAMLAAARAVLEAKGWDVLGGFLSPSHDLYVGEKAATHGTAHATAEHRVAIADLLVAEHPWVAVARWEARQEGRWPDFPEVALACHEWLRSANFGDAQVFYVCGTDHARGCKEFRNQTGFRDKRLGLVVVPRSGEKPRKIADRENLYYWAEPPDEVPLLREFPFFGSAPSLREWECHS